MVTAHYYHKPKKCGNNREMPQHLNIDGRKGVSRILYKSLFMADKAWQQKQLNIGNKGGETDFCRDSKTDMSGTDQDSRFNTRRYILW